MSANDRDSGAAQLLGNGGKIEPYTIIIMHLLTSTDTCVNEKAGNGICDLENNWEICDFDGGDCKCFGAGNSWCQPEFNIEECDWDGGDCCGPYAYVPYGFTDDEASFWEGYTCLDPGT
jgi:hypothetical protein